MTRGGSAGNRPFRISIDSSSAAYLEEFLHHEGFERSAPGLSQSTGGRIKHIKEWSTGPEPAVREQFVAAIRKVDTLGAARLAAAA